MVDYRIAELDSSNEYDWEEFNKKSSDGSFFHTLKYKKIIENSFPLKLYYYLIYLNDKVIAICPFYENTIKGFRGLMSLPLSDYRHILFNRQDSSHLDGIIKEIIEISRGKKYSFVMITSKHQDIFDSLKKYNPLRYPYFGKTGNFVLNLEENPSKKIWNDTFRYDERRRIKAFEKDGFEIREAKSKNDLEMFYKYYKLNLEYKNRKPYPFSFFEKLWDAYSSTDLRVTLLHKGENIHGGMFAFIYPALKTIYIRHYSIDRALSARYRVVDYVNWECILYASNMKYTTVCFGETPLNPSEPTYKVKEKFGGFFETIYSCILPHSLIFRIGYNAYKYINIPQQLKKIRNKNYLKMETNIE